VIACRATFDVPRETVQFTARLLATERRRRGTPRGSRALTCFWQAVLGLRWFRDRTSPDVLARDHGISWATAYRYLDEVTAVLSARAPDLRGALERARAHGGNVQAVLAPGGFPLRVSPAEPGSVHDITAARTHALPALYAAAAAGLAVLADAGYDGASPAIRIRPSSVGTAPRSISMPSPATCCCARCGAGGERGFALLKGRWRTLKRITASPERSATSPAPPSS
jgi:hypothetical protein